MRGECYSEHPGGSPPPRTVFIINYWGAIACVQVHEFGRTRCTVQGSAVSGSGLHFCLARLQIDFLGFCRFTYGPLLHMNPLRRLWAEAARGEYRIPATPESSQSHSYPSRYMHCSVHETTYPNLLYLSACYPHPEAREFLSHNICRRTYTPTIAGKENRRESV